MYSHDCIRLQRERARLVLRGHAPRGRHAAHQPGRCEAGGDRRLPRGVPRSDGALSVHPQRHAVGHALHARRHASGPQQRRPDTVESSRRAARATGRLQQVAVQAQEVGPCVMSVLCSIVKAKIY